MPVLSLIAVGISKYMSCKVYNTAVALPGPVTLVYLSIADLSSYLLERDSSGAKRHVVQAT
jgi:hypothetical protein